MLDPAAGEPEASASRRHRQPPMIFVVSVQSADRTLPYARRATQEGSSSSRTDLFIWPPSGFDRSGVIFSALLTIATSCRAARVPSR